MKKLILASFLLATVALTFSSCKDKEKSFEVKPAQFDVDRTTQSKAFDITNAEGSWAIQINDEAEWIRVNPAMGNGDATVTVFIDSNVTREARSASMTIKLDATGATKRVVVNQEATITPSFSTLTPFLGMGQEKDLTINAQFSWSIVDREALPEWLSLSKTTGNTGTETIKITTIENPEVLERTYTLKALIDSGTFNQLEVSILVRQLGARELIGIEGLYLLNNWCELGAEEDMSFKNFDVFLGYDTEAKYFELTEYTLWGYEFLDRTGKALFRFVELNDENDPLKPYTDGSEHNGREFGYTHGISAEGSEEDPVGTAVMRESGEVLLSQSYYIAAGIYADNGDLYTLSANDGSDIMTWFELDENGNLICEEPNGYTRSDMPGAICYTAIYTLTLDVDDNEWYITGGLIIPILYIKDTDPLDMRTGDILPTPTEKKPNPKMQNTTLKKMKLAPGAKLIMGKPIRKK